MGEEQKEEERVIAPTTEDDLLLALGKMTANFAMLEFHVATGIWFLIGGLPRTGPIVTAGLSFKQLVNIFHALMLEKSGTKPDAVETVGGFRKALFNAEEQRNKLTHSIWPAGPEDRSTRNKDSIARGEWKLSIEKHSAEQISGLALEFEALALEISHFVFLQTIRPDAKGS